MFINYLNTNCQCDIVVKKRKKGYLMHTGKIMNRDRELLIPLLPLKNNQYCKIISETENVSEEGGKSLQAKETCLTQKDTETHQVKNKNIWKPESQQMEHRFDNVTLQPSSDKNYVDECLTSLGFNFFFPRNLMTKESKLLLSVPSITQHFKIIIGLFF